MKIAVIGTGYVGLVTGTCLAEVGHDVTCVDIDKNKIAALKNGIVPIYEPGLAELVKKNSQAGNLHFTTKMAETGTPKAIFFALPTPPNGDGEADVSFVLQAAKNVAKMVKQHTVLINKSTVPVGTAKKVQTIVAEHTKVKCDVVSNPEFLKEGFAVDDFMQPDRIIAGTSSARARSVVEEIYQPFIIQGVPLLFMDTASAEMTKYAANSFLATKISFMNEIANLCELIGANVDNVREGIGADDRIGKKFLHAGIGYGGSCFPKDVMALEKIAQHSNYDFKIITAVMEVNRRQIALFIDKILARYGDDLHNTLFAVWGLAFKANTDDIRQSPPLEIIRILLGYGAKIQAYDPKATENVKRLIGDKINYAKSATAALKNTNALLVVTEWPEFSAANPQVIAKNVKDKVVFDGRNLFDPQAMHAAGLHYISVGRP